MVLSKFFRDTLQKALGGDEIWQVAKELHNGGAGGSGDGARNGAGGGGNPAGPRALDLSGISLSSLSLQAHMALFGAGALTDSDGRPLDAHGNYLDGGGPDAFDGSGTGRSRPDRAVPIAPFPPKKFFLDAEVEQYENELREQLKRDHESRVRDYEDMVNLARRRWHMDATRLDDFREQQQLLVAKTAKVEGDAQFLGKAVKNQWDIY